MWGQRARLGLARGTYQDGEFVDPVTQSEFALSLPALAAVCATTISTVLVDLASSAAIWGVVVEIALRPSAPRPVVDLAQHIAVRSF